MCVEQEHQEHKLRSRTQTQKLKKKKRKIEKKQIPLLESESAKLHKYNLITRNEIQI